MRALSSLMVCLPAPTARAVLFSSSQLENNNYHNKHAYASQLESLFGFILCTYFDL
jgi:hypothetical protein